MMMTSNREMFVLVIGKKHLIVFFSIVASFRGFMTEVHEQWTGGGTKWQKAMMNIKLANCDRHEHQMNAAAPNSIGGGT